MSSKNNNKKSHYNKPDKSNGEESKGEQGEKAEVKIKKATPLLSIQDYCSTKGFPEFAKIAAIKLYSGQKQTLQNWEKTLEKFNFKKK